MTHPGRHLAVRSALTTSALAALLVACTSDARTEATASHTADGRTCAPSAYATPTFPASSTYSNAVPRVTAAPKDPLPESDPDVKSFKQGPHGSTPGYDISIRVTSPSGAQPLDSTGADAPWAVEVEIYNSAGTYHYERGDFGANSADCQITTHAYNDAAAAGGVTLGAGQVVEDKLWCPASVRHGVVVFDLDGVAPSPPPGAGAVYSVGATWSLG